MVSEVRVMQNGWASDRAIEEKGWFRQNLKTLALYRDSIIIVLSTLLLSLIPILIPGQESKCGYVILLMAIFWTTEAVPIAVTSIIPVFAFPLMGILSTDDVCLMYMKETVMMFFGGITVAIAVEYCRLHERIALKILILIGQSPPRLMAGFMVSTAFLSMWLSNTASTVMLVPIVEGVLVQLCSGTSENPERSKLIKGTSDEILSSPNDQELLPIDHNSKFSLNRRRSSMDHTEITIIRGQLTSHDTTEAEENQDEEGDEGDDTVLRNALMSSVMCAANLGGTGVITGTGPNMVLKSILDNTYKEPTGINFLTWMLFNIPGMIICVFLSWIWLQVYYLGLFRGKKKNRVSKTSEEKQAAVKRLVQDKYRDLGPMRFQEIIVLTLFILLVILWLFRAPEFIQGWSSYFYDAYGVKVQGATPAMLIVFLIFCMPAKLNFACFRNSTDDKRTPGDKNECLTWEAVQARTPWGIILLLGGGFAMAEAAKVSGLSTWLGAQLYIFHGMHPGLMVLIVTLISAMVTEIVSNTATSLIVLPVLNELAQQMKVNPIYLMLPATISASYAFMLPVATPPNAIVFSAAKMRSSQMMRIGFALNIVCVLVVNLMINTLGVAMFDVHNIPTWMNSTIH